MKIAIIGAKGFIGSHLNNLLSKNSLNTIFLFGRSHDDLNVLGTNYYRLTGNNFEEFEDVFNEIDLVYYLASSSIPASTWESPDQEIESNLLPFLSFLKFISLTKVKKISFVSSAGTIYGASMSKVKEEYDKRPFSPHGIVKLTMENFLEYYRRKCNIQYDIFRVSNVYGEGQEIKKGLGLINTLLENILTQGKVRIFGDGNNFRNYIYVKDLVRLMQYSVSHNLSESAVFNLSSHDSYTVNQIISTLKRIVPESFEVEYLSQRKSDNEYIDIDNSKILSFFPEFTFTPFESAISDTYTHIKSKLSETGLL